MRPAEPRHLALPLALLAFAACAPVDVDHPLDPRTPTERQIPCRVSGHLTTPAGADPAVFRDAEVELWRAEAGADTIDSTLAYAAPVDAAGRFRFDAVTPGLYRLDARAGALEADPLVLSLPAGQTLDIGAITLEPVLGTIRGRITDPDGEPIEGARATVDTQWVEAAPDGRFDLMAPAGPVTLIAAADGFDEVRVDLDVAPRAITALAGPLALSPQPAAISGVVALRRFGTPERLAATAIELDGADAGGPIDGAFAFPDLAPGEHTLDFANPGYDPVTRRVVLAPGERVELAPVELQHASTGPDAVWLEALVTAGEPIAGIAVTVRLDGLPFARAVSDRDGRIAVPAARADQYWLEVDAAGFAPATLGPLTWDGDGFVGPDGAPPRLDLQTLP